jgi:hypothetical protein
MPSRGHDDLLISTALKARLGAMDWWDRAVRGVETVNRHNQHLPQ